jgi:hypothetical protein
MVKGVWEIKGEEKMRERFLRGREKKDLKSPNKIFTYSYTILYIYKLL